MTRRGLCLIALVALLASCSAGTASSGSTSGSAALSTVPEGCAQPPPTLAASTMVPRSTWPAPGSFVGPEHVVRSDGREVAVRQFGRGPDLVLLEAEEMSMTEWPLSLLRSLSTHWRVTMFDWPGIGRSTENPTEPYTIGQLADDTASLFTALGLRRPDVFGFSTGGEVGLALAVFHPAQVCRLAVSGATPGGPDTVPTPPAVESLFLDPNTDPFELLALSFPPGDKTDPGDYAAELLLVPQTLASPATTDQQNDAEAAFAAGPGLASGLRSVRLPVLVLDGQLDQLVPAENARRIAAVIPGATLMIFPGAGHMVIYEERAALVNALRTFFAGKPPSAGDP